MTDNGKCNKNWKRYWNNKRGNLEAKQNIKKEENLVRNKEMGHELQGHITPI